MGRVGRLQHRWFIVLMLFIGGQLVLAWTVTEDYFDNKEVQKSLEPMPATLLGHQNKYCIPPAIEQFPRPLIGPSARKHIWLVPHVLFAMVTVVGLTVVSKDYYVPCLYRISESTELTPDVVGATFMAAGSSASQLAIIIVSYFCANDNIDVNSVVVSSAYNMVFVISLCALTAATALPLNWRPFCLNCFFYAISTLVMLVGTSEGYVNMLAAFFMLMTYGIYCAALLLSRVLGPWLCCDCKSGKQVSAQPSSGQAQVEMSLRNPPSIYPVIVSDSGEPGAGESNSDACSPNTARGEQPATAVSAQHEAAHNSEIALNPLIKPNGGNRFQLSWWFISYPAHCLFRLTIPDYRGRWYFISYLVSVLWISFFAFFMVWMITIIVFTLGIPDSLMSLTVIPMAVSLTNAVSSLAIVKKGYGDMVMSNAIGSCLFNILVCLGMPWSLTAVIRPGAHIYVISKGLVYTACKAYSTLTVLLLATLCGRKLNKKYGVALMVWFLFFITVSYLYEANYFGEFNPPVCNSMY